MKKKRKWYQHVQLEAEVEKHLQQQKPKQHPKIRKRVNNQLQIKRKKRLLKLQQ